MIRTRVACVALLLATTTACSSMRTSEGGEFEPREYAFSAEAVVEMSKDACVRYFDVPATVRRERPGDHELWVNNNNLWAGDTDVSIFVRSTGPDQSVVDVESHGSGFNAPIWNRSRNDIAGFFEHLDQIVAADGPEYAWLYPDLVEYQSSEVDSETEARVADVRLMLETRLISQEEHDRAITAILAGE